MPSSSSANTSSGLYVSTPAPRLTTQQKGKARVTIAEEVESSDEEEEQRVDSTMAVQARLVFDQYPVVKKESTRKRLGLYVLAHIQYMERRNQHVPPRNTEQYMELYLRILDLELQEYIGRKAIRGSAASTPENAELRPSNYNLGTAFPQLDQAIELLHAPRQGNETDEEFTRRQAAAQRQRNMSGIVMPDQSIAETITTTPATHVPGLERGAGAVSPVEVKAESVDEQLDYHRNDIPLPEREPSPLPRIALAEVFADRVNYQRMRNEEMRVQGHSRIDDQGITFEGERGVTPIDDMRRQFITRTSQPPGDPDGGDDSEGSDGEDEGNNRPPNDHNNRDPGRNPERPPDRDNDRNDRRPGREPDRSRRSPDHEHTREVTQPRDEVNRRTPRAYSMPQDIEITTRNPGVSEAMRHYKNHMHDRLCGVIDDAVGEVFKLPDGVKLRKSDPRHIVPYSGGSKFSDLENWLMDLCDHLASSNYTGDRLDRARLLALSEFLTGEAKKWFWRHIRHYNRSQRQWTFKSAILGLYDRFVNPSTMQDARDAFLATVYTEKLGIQGFYDTLIDHAQNMSVFPDAYTILEAFLDGLPSDMRRYLFKQDKLTPEVNSVEEFLAHA
ncbi:hypothetical protein H0H93_010466, partial [Arthromyces matolae]